MSEETNKDLDQELEQQLEAVEGSTAGSSAAAEKKPSPTTLDGKTTKDDEPVDPFARLAKKKVAKPQTMQEMMDKKVKKGRKLSPKIFLIGCISFFIFFLGLMFAGLYYAISSAGVLESIGLEIEDVKTILMIFAVLFFGLIFLIGFYILVLNIYRLVTVKGKKIKYVFGLLLGLFVLVGTIIGGTLSINKIRGLAGQQVIQSINLVLSYVETRDGNIFAEDGIPLIAPLRMNFVLNKTSNADVIKDINASIQRQQPHAVELDCGNGQILPMDPRTTTFVGSCLFTDKEPYQFVLRVTDESGLQEYPAAGFTPQAEIDLEPIDDTAYLNDNKTEQIIGIAPVNVRFRAQKLFTDLSLADDSIEWDLDGDNRIDLSDNATFEQPYDDSKLHTIAYRLPELPGRGETWFTFDLRVVESELARCTLDIKELNPQQRTYTFTPRFDEKIQAQSYHYTIYDAVQGDIIDKLKESSEVTTFSFPKGGVYTVSASYFTAEDQKGSCAVEELEVGFNGNQVAFDLKWKQKDNEPFTNIGDGTPVVFDEERSLINVSTLPAILEFTVTDIQPDPTADLTVLYNDRQLFADRDGVYEVSIASLGEKEFVFEVETKQGNISTQPYTIDVSRSPVRANIKVEPALVGEDPFAVVLDASISDLYNEEDEIVFFTWDFGDGETRENISQGKVNHTYRYDTDASNGEFYPSVTVKTKLGHEDSYRLESPLSVKKKQKEAIIRVESHPTQQVRVGELVTFALETDGVVEQIDWNFGNTKTFGCDDRSCTNPTMRYYEAGEYEIKVDIQYANDTPIVGRVKIKVYE